MKPENGCRGGSSLASYVTNIGHWIWSLIPKSTESTLPQQEKILFETIWLISCNSQSLKAN